MLVPVSGNFDPSEVNRRRMAPIPKALRDQDPKKFPPVYIFNVGPRRHELPPNDRGSRFIEACPPGAKYSEPTVFRNIEMETYDLADGGGNMGRLDEDGTEKALALIHSYDSLSLETKNLQWFGVFVTENEVPTAKEIADAKAKLGRMMRLIYDRGSESVLQGVRVQEGDRAIYNEAATILGKAPLFGVADHTMDKCVYCLNSIIEGARICTHCGQRQDSEDAKKLRASDKKVA